MDYESWCACSNEDLAARDIAEVNLACAEGLPGAEDLDVPSSLQTLDHWAELVERATKKALRRRINQGIDSDLPLAQFKMLVLVTVLQRDLRLRYNQAFMEGAYDGSDSRNLFVHGLLTGHGGTCVTMPVL